ncbi:MAG TPA: hypothetical protein VF092_11375 [Longimicrobium sp.]
MKKLLQRIRGAIGIGLTWAAGWAPIGAVTGWITASLLHFPMGTVITNYAVTFGVLGFVGGTIFSTVLSLAEGRRSFDQLSLPRFAAWGAVGGLVLGGLSAAVGLLGAGLTIQGAVMAGAAALLGAGSAAGMLVIARAAQGQALPRGDVARGRLTGDARGLLGNAE